MRPGRQPVVHCRPQALTKERKHILSSHPLPTMKSPPEPATRPEGDTDVLGILGGEGAKGGPFPGHREWLQLSLVPTASVRVEEPRQRIPLPLNWKVRESVYV